MDGGFLPGGGLALIRAAAHLESLTTDNLQEKTVNKIVADSCMSPLRQILKNADLSSDYIIERVKENSSFTWGYDVRENKYCDLIESGIIDPLLVTISALSNATSVACSLINIGCVVLGGQDAFSENDVQLMQLSEDME